MRKDRLYLFTFLSLAIIFLIISSIANSYFVEEAVEEVLSTQLEFSKREAKQMAILIGNQLENGISSDTTIANVQESIENSNLDAGFISVFDWSGKVVCHPDKKQVGQIANSKKSFVSSVSDNLSSEDLFKLLKEKNALNDDQNLNNEGASSEVLSLYPVKNSDWIVAAHANSKKVSLQIETIRKKFQIILLVMGFLFILLSVVIVRLIGSRYETKLEAKNEKLSDEIINLTKLNNAVNSYQEKIVNEPETTTESETDTDVDSDESTNVKKRILTYIRHELLPISTDSIAYIYTENTITYVVCFDGTRSTTNSSLDDLYTNLDNTYFFRANRQFIIAISAIDKIIRYGNNQLKILIKSNDEADIIISKNKAAEFKKWLNL